MGRYITLNQVTALAQTVIKDSDDRDRNVWGQWAYEALSQLGIGDDEIKVAEVFPQDYTGTLPDDCRHVIEFSLLDSSGNQLPHQYRAGKYRIYPDNRVPVAATTSTLDNCVPVDVSTSRTNIHLGTNGSNVYKILLRYFSYPLAEDGTPLIREEDSMACVYFIRYMQGMRQDDNRSKIAQDQQSWFMEADRARARKKMSSMSPDKCRSVMMSLISMTPNWGSIQQF